jgi:S1-C subfamily serine protease
MNDAMSAIGQQLNGEISDILAMAGRSLVRISHTHYGSGAGTVIHPDGLILTNAHVVRHGLPEVTLPDERKLPAKILAYDAQLDLAALAVEGHNLPPLELGDSTKLQPGELVFALGHPWGVNGAVSAGSVICVGRPPELPTTNEFIQSDLQLRPGHSGGPMVDMQGRLVGINTLITGPEVGLAIPVHVIKEFLQRALAA